MDLPIATNLTADCKLNNYHYKPTIWRCNSIESLKSNYMGEKYMSRFEELNENLKMTLKTDVETLTSLELIDDMERLGVGYLFEEEIKQIIDSIYCNTHNNSWMKDNLYAIALHFKVLRQHGYLVSQEVFMGFMNDKHNFKEELRWDVKGLLCLYDAAHVSLEGESILIEAIKFTKQHLSVFKGNLEPIVAEEVNRSLEIPLHWRMPRSEARWYIRAYEKETRMNPDLLELAKLDFNMVQAVHQKDLKNMSRWWRSIDLGTELRSARDRLTETFLASVGISYRPQHSRCREWLTKVMKLVLIIDDIYDIFGSLEELEVLSNAFERWDIEEMHKVPSYMKTCFLAVYNTINEMAYIIHNEQGWEILPYMKKSWANFVRAMLVEAKWCNAEYTPLFREYIENGWLSSSGSVILVHAFFATNQMVTSSLLESLENKTDLIYCTSMILRLSNDLATSSAELERGDTTSSVNSYMHVANVSENEAREHIRGLIMNMWEKMNKSISKSPFDSEFVEIAINLARTSLFIYQHGDGIGVENSKCKDHILSLIINPIEE